MFKAISALILVTMMLGSATADEVVRVRGQLFRKVCDGVSCRLERIADVVTPDRVLAPEPIMVEQTYVPSPDPVPMAEVVSAPVVTYEPSIPEPVNAPFGFCDVERPKLFHRLRQGFRKIFR